MIRRNRRLPSSEISWESQASPSCLHYAPSAQHLRRRQRHDRASSPLDLRVDPAQCPSRHPNPERSKSSLKTLLKSFALIFNPIAERIGNRLKRKPRLHIYVRPLTNVWCYAWNGYGENQKPMMQARFTADITNDGYEGILILDGYIKGPKPKLPFPDRIEVPPTTTVAGKNIAVFCTPVVGEGGKDFVGRIILIDQFKRKHPSDKITFTWVGPTEPPKPLAPLSPKQLQATEPPASLVTIPSTASKAPADPNPIGQPNRRRIVIPEQMASLQVRYNRCWNQR